MRILGFVTYYVNGMENKRHETQHYTKCGGVVLDGGLLDIHLLEQVRIFVPFHQGLHIVSFTFQKN